ncbi:MAG: citramalate synthase [bacterium]
MTIKIFDTTLRDGAQGANISFSADDKIRIAQQLDDLGIHYVEGGWPGSNPKDVIFFQRAKSIRWKRTKITAFGSTRRAANRPEDDPNLRALIEAETPAVAIFGKSWDLHVRDVLRVPLEANIEMVADSIAYCKRGGREVLFDAEHFFDGFKNNREYAMKILAAAAEAGADTLVLCDTNGGTLPMELVEIIDVVRGAIETPLGIHIHNDSDVAVANTILAVQRGIRHVQGTMNGYGERCGNANLCTIIPNLQLKLGMDCIGDNIKRLTEVSRFVSELANTAHREDMPYVGNNAFAHKGGMHVDAVEKNPSTFEHVPPSAVGNHRRILISELSGQSNILYKAAEYGLDLHKGDKETKKILDELKELENYGYQFEGAEGSFEILMKKAMGLYKEFFTLNGFRVIVERRNDKCYSEASIKVTVGDETFHTAADGHGPVSALDRALRKALEEFYPSLKSVKLDDFKVRILDEKAGTDARVRVLVESNDGEERWGTVGVSEDIIEASWLALVDSLEYKLMRDEKRQLDMQES